MIKGCALGRSCCWHSSLASRTLVMIETVSQIALTALVKRHWPSLVLSNCEIKRTPLRRTGKAGPFSKDQSVSLSFRPRLCVWMCVSYFMTLDNCFHLSVASVLTSIAVRFALGRCWYLTGSLFKMWYGFISSEAWAAKHSLLRSYKVHSRHCLAGSKSVTVLTRWRECRTFNICCLWLFRSLQPIDF